MKFEWEDISCDSIHETADWYEETFRAKTMGGWIVMHRIMYGDNKETEKDGWERIELSMVFIPDLEHLWEIEKD